MFSWLGPGYIVGIVCPRSGKQKKRMEIWPATSTNVPFGPNYRLIGKFIRLRLVLEVERAFTKYTTWTAAVEIDHHQERNEEKHTGMRQ